MIEENNDDATFRTQQIRKERKSMKKDKYQRLNRFELSNYKSNEKDEMSMNNIEEKMFIIMSRKRQSRQSLQTQKRVETISIEKLNDSTRFIFKFTYKIS